MILFLEFLWEFEVDQFVQFYTRGKVDEEIFSTFVTYGDNTFFIDGGQRCFGS